MDEAVAIMVEAASRFGIENSAISLQVYFVLLDEQSSQMFKNALGALDLSKQGSFAPSVRIRNNNKKLLKSGREDTTQPPNNETRLLKSNEIIRDYKAAGVVLYTVRSGELNILLGLEDRIGEGLVLNVLGGRAEPRDQDYRHTAAREFHEESKSPVSEKVLKRMLASEQATAIYFDKGQYVLYLVDCLPELEKLDVSFQQSSRHSEMDKLLWVKWKTLLEGSKKQPPHITMRSWRRVVDYNISEFLQKLLNCPLILDIVERRACQTATSNMQSEFDSLLRESWDPFPEDDKEWRLRLAFPPSVSTSFPIIPLERNSAEYQAVSQRFSSSPPIITIRKVNCEVREAEHDKLVQELQKQNGSDKVHKIEPVFHGTPERWRATNIALKSFDLSIVRNGRSSGNGVYTATDIQTPLGYSNNQGSILQMKAILAPNDHGYQAEMKGPPFTPGTILVFRQAAQVLPRYVIDFASPGQDDAALEKKAKEQHLHDAAVAREEMERQQRLIQSMEDQYAAERIRNSQSSSNYFKQRIETYQKDFQDTTENDQMAWNKVEKIMRLVDIECRQFRNGAPLPIYYRKHSLIKTIRENDVILVSSSTGSGKSTQLPQYILDDILEPCNDHRRVAVLEPKRFNAITLCQRVAKERSQQVGNEIGYSLGQGDCCASAVTRIEYMTHGLFINRALNSKKLLSVYGAVILDEAHVRSVEVDLCFKLLLNALKYSKQEGGRSFKIIIASATLGDREMGLYLNYFKESIPLCRATTCDASGQQCFPVLTVHRAEAEPDWEEANSLETTKALAVHAVEIALQLIRASDEGNILIFMPGESIINTCLANIQNWVLFKTKSQPTAKQGIPWNNSLDFEFKLTIDSDGGKEKKIVIGVYPFHGKVSARLRQKMLFHKGQDRIIIFSTNIAETGITLPNIRYVIDTGLERRVIWNPTSGIQEMKTMKVTASSMKQRLGRAGRVASGICVRLYSEDTAKSLDEEIQPEIKNGMILRLVLTMKQLAKQGDDGKLLTEVPPTSWESAEKMLQLLEALDENKELNSVGQALLTLGLDLRMGRFLIACNSAGCLGSGILITAMVTLSNKLDFLPLKTVGNYAAKEFLDPNGDHFTLMAIFQAYLGAKNKNSFCSDYDLDPNVMEEAKRSKEHLEMICLKMGWRQMDRKNAKPEDIRKALRESLCAAFFDQIINAIVPGSPAKKFIRILPKQESQRFRSSMKSFLDSAGLGDREMQGNSPQSFLVSSGALKAKSTQDEGNADDDYDDDNYDGSDASSQGSIYSANTNITPTLSPAVPSQQKQQTLTLTQQSSLWLLAEQQTATPLSLAVFTSIMITDSAREPVIHLVSYIDADDVVNGAKQWSEKINFGKIYRKIKPITRRYPISSQLAKYLLLQKGSAMRKYFSTYDLVDTKVDKDKKELIVTAPQHILEYFNNKIKELEEETDREEFCLPLPSLTNTEDKTKIIKLFGRGKAKNEEKEHLVNDLNKMVLDALGDQGDYLPLQLNDVGVDNTSSPWMITVRVSGSGKQLSSLMLGHIHSLIAQTLRQQPTQSFDSVQIKNASSTAILSKSNNFLPNLALFSTSVPPVAPFNHKNKAMVFLAHEAIWNANCKIYGGFVRDFIIRNEVANDIDIAYDSRTQSLSQIQLIIISAANKIGLRCTDNWRQKGMAQSRRFILGNQLGGSSFEVDLVDQNVVSSQGLSPGVDCDVGNFIVQKPGHQQFGLQLKVNHPMLQTVHQSIRHCLAKEFVFYYDQNNPIGQARLQKYLQRGWKCLTKLQPVMQTWATSAGYANLLAPQKQYSKPYYNLVNR
eukprot:scaffold7245_cov197-Ochromonas_danica.AAC.7